MLSASGGYRAERLHAASRALDLLVDDAQVERLLRFVDILHRWNATYNLTAVRNPDDMLGQHVIDCMAAVGAMQRRLGAAGRRVLDVGSGGGLPGVVIAVLRAEDEVLCVDAVGKKTAFIQQVAADLKLANLSAKHARVEALQTPPFEIVTSRAFGALADFVRRTRPHLAPGGMWMAMKGKRPDAEISAVPENVDVFHVEQLAVPGLSADRCIVWMRPGARI